MSRKVLYCLIVTTLHAACAPLHATMHAPSPVASTPSYGKDLTKDASIKTQKGRSVSLKDRTARQRLTTAHKKPQAKDATRIQQVFGALCVVVVVGFLYWHLSTDKNRPPPLGETPLEEKKRQEGKDVAKNSVEKDLDDIPDGTPQPLISLKPLTKDLPKGDATPQVKIEDLQARTSNIANLKREHPKEVRDYLDAFVQLLRRDALGSPEDKAHLYRIRDQDPTVESTKEQRKKIVEQLTQEAANDTPVYFHATKPNMLENILVQQGELLPAYTQQAPGVFVSTEYEDSYGDYILGFRRGIERYVPICYAAHKVDNLLGRGYWVAFYEAIPVWDYVAKIYVNTSRVREHFKDAPKRIEPAIKDMIKLVEDLLQAQQANIEAKLAGKLPENERVRMQKLKQKIADIEVVRTEGKAKIPVNTVIPRGYIMHTKTRRKGTILMLTTDEDQQPIFEPASIEYKNKRTTTKMDNGQEKYTYEIRDPYGHRMIARQKEGKGTHFLEPLEG